MTNLEKAARALARVYFTNVDAPHEVDKHRPADQQRAVWTTYVDSVRPVLAALNINPDGEVP